GRRGARGVAVLPDAPVDRAAGLAAAAREAHAHLAVAHAARAGGRGDRTEDTGIGLASARERSRLACAGRWIQLCTHEYPAAPAEPHAGHVARAGHVLRRRAAGDVGGLHRFCARRGGAAAGPVRVLAGVRARAEPGVPGRQPGAAIWRCAAFRAWHRADHALGSSVCQRLVGRTRRRGPDRPHLARRRPDPARGMVVGAVERRALTREVPRHKLALSGYSLRSCATNSRSHLLAASWW